MGVNRHGTALSSFETQAADLAHEEALAVGELNDAMHKFRRASFGTGSEASNSGGNDNEVFGFDGN